MEIGLIMIGVLSLFLYIWYAKIISRRNAAQSALSGIDVQLTKRSELVPNILAIAKKFMEHENSLIREVTALRAKASEGYDQLNPESVAQHLRTSAALGSQMGKLMISMEAYPDLKSDTAMVTAQQTYNELEAQIAAARRFYNSSVAELNNSIEIFPGTFLAGIANSKTMPFFEADDAALQPVNASDYLK